MNSLKQLILFASCMVLTSKVPANPEYAAKHGIKGVMTYNDSSQLPKKCTKLAQRTYETPISEHTQYEMSQRLGQHTITAIGLGANFAVASPEYLLIEYYKCEEHE